jgi:OmpA-OmpF porin, OOP family
VLGQRPARAVTRPEPVPERTAPRTVERGPQRAPEHASRLWPLLLLVPLLVAGGLLLRRREAPPEEPWTPRTGLGVGVPGSESPAVPTPEVEAPPAPERREVTPPPPSPRAALPPPSAIAPGPATEMSRFLASRGGDTSRRFVFEDLTFDFATPNLTPGALPTLDAVAAALKASPGAQILVEGHTDATGVPADNERLSLERASAVKNALVARGVDADSIAVAGLGQDQPIAPNDTPEGRAKNRRTEIVVTRR